MKKLIKIFVAIFAMFAMVSCDMNVEGVTKENEGGLDVIGIQKFEYEGHKYIAFDMSTPYSSVGVVHDPSCPCINE